MAVTDVLDDNEFAQALRDAVEDSGLGLERLQSRLADRDVAVSVATLSYWQTGARMPGRRRSLEVVAHLEAVLGLEPRALRRLVPAPRPRGPIPEAPAERLVPKISTREAVRRIAERVQRPDGMQLARISQHDVVTINADRRVESTRIKTICRADADGIEGIGVTQFFEDASAGTPWLTVHTGATVHARHIDPEHRIIGSELRFGRPLRRGETVILDYEITSVGPGPRDTSYDTSCALPIREYSLLVRFPMEDLPEDCEEFSQPNDGIELRRKVPIDVLGHAHSVVVDRPAGTNGLTWSYA